MAFENNSRRPSNPRSVLLQDALREKKAQTQRVASLNGLGDGHVQSSPLASKSVRNGSSGHDRRNSLPKEMGMKEREELVSKINKQNFDLKLEVFHLRERNEVLEEKVEKSKALETDNEEMQAINEDLLLELEKRDIAIQEAVGLICELEAKIEEMADAEAYFERHSRKSESVPDTFSGKTITPNGPKSEPESSSLIIEQRLNHKQRSHDEVHLEKSPSRQDTSSPRPSQSPQRVPSFILDAKKGTNVLRSLYSANPSSRPDSLLSGDEDDDWESQQILSSPRLSVLSESGFSSIYNYKGNDPTPASVEDNNLSLRSPRNAASPSPSRQREARLQKWMEERNRPTTPTKVSPKAGIKDQFSSIGQVLEKIPSAPQDRQGQRSPRQQDLSPERSPKMQTMEPQVRKRRPSSPAFGGPIFGGGYLPPTPDTMSTLTVTGNSSTQSIITEKSLIDRPHTSGKGGFPNSIATALTFDSGKIYESSEDEQSSTRPRSKTSAGSIRSANSQRSPNAGGRNGATRHTQNNAPAVRPSLATSGTAIIFSSEAYLPTQFSRTVSYPSPTGPPRRPSNQLSPSNSLTMTSLKRSPGARSISSATTIKDLRAHPSPNPQAETTAKPARSASFRSMMTSRISKTPNSSNNQSVASRLFRRATSTNQDTRATNPARPQITRPPSNHARIPRPSSLYRGKQSSSVPHDTLASILPEDMLTDLERYSSFRN